MLLLEYDDQMSIWNNLKMLQQRKAHSSFKPLPRVECGPDLSNGNRCGEQYKLVAMIQPSIFSECEG